MGKKIISVFTATRAEYHLLYSLIKKINEDEELILDLIVSGTHLSKKFGNTVDYIISDGFPIGERIETLNENRSIDDIIAVTLSECSKHFRKVKSDYLVVLGDRYEIMGAVIAAANALIPIAHIHGGETTIGAIDEAVRHAVTKFSYLHFTSCEPYRKRVIQLGEHPDRVFNTGSLGVENILNQPLMSKEELAHDLLFNLDNYAVVTFHPLTLDKNGPENQVSNLIDALMEFDGLNYIITKANADAGGERINEILEMASSKTKRIKLVSSLGLVRYLSALKYCKMVIGNSSSGVLEAPSFCVPTVNIGDRQTGRIKSKSIIDCLPEKNSIINAMRKALEPEFRNSLQDMPQIYGDGNASAIMIDEIKKSLNGKVNLMKKFYDLD